MWRERPPVPEKVPPRVAERPVLTPASPPDFILEDDITSFPDDLDQASLETAVGRSLQYYDSVPDSRVYSFGTDRYTAAEMKESLLAFLEIIRGPEPVQIKRKRIRENFSFYRSAGRKDNGGVLFTGYFEPLLDGSLERTDVYRYPIYRVPDDVVVVNLGKFKSKFQGERIVGRLENRELIPYFKRQDIDSDGLLAGRGLEIAWLADPVDLFFLHIQGSGMIRLQDGRTIQVSYAECNGRPYRSIGRLLLDQGRISEKEISHRSIKQYLYGHPEELAEILNHNESYVFFRIVDGGPIGSLGIPVTGGRSIATDQALFPRGALCMIQLRKPVFDECGEIKRWVRFSRFVLNQDAGGVIKGPARVDLFCGRGREAEWIAGSLKETGDLYFLVKKKKQDGKPQAEDRAH
ncbi:MAG: murein transglycosylase A [Syntrophales bacterium]